ncbi:MAG: hypothetical protein SXA11_25380 [Cyanobacteriota bacterium]|nr:hypothetical protein [Cyanobacteriota bacterium]
MDQAELCSKKKIEAYSDAELSTSDDRSYLAKKESEKNFHSCHLIQYRGGDTS